MISTVIKRDGREKNFNPNNIHSAIGRAFIEVDGVVNDDSQIIINRIVGQISELNKDYVRTARSKGNTESNLLYRHVFKNALIPVVTFLAMVVGDILAGSIVVEQVFSVQGLGRLLISSISARDYPVVQAIVLYVTTLVVGINFVVDILYQWIDPRVKKG